MVDPLRATQGSAEAGLCVVAGFLARLRTVVADYLARRILQENPLKAVRSFRRLIGLTFTEIKRLLSGDRKWYLLVASVAIFLRGLPEILLGRYPAGFDATAYYPYGIVTFHSWRLGDALGLSPLFYAMMWLVVRLFGIDVYLLLKLAGPFLYGALAASFLRFLQKYVVVRTHIGTVGTLVLISQPVVMRLSWDLFRNELGLVFLFLTFAELGQRETNRRLLIAGTFSILNVASHPLTGVLFFVGLTGFLAQRKNVSRRLLLTFAPSFVLLAVVLLMDASRLTSLFPQVASNRFMFAGHADTGKPFFFLDNVFVEDFRLRGLSLVQVWTNVLYLFLVSFLPIVFWVVVGLRRERATMAMALWLIMGAFSVLIFPTSALPAYWRWLLLLWVPFGVYAVNGISRTWGLMTRNRFVLGGILLLYLTIGIGYSSGLFSYVQGPGINYYMPHSMVESSISKDPGGLIAALAWVNQNVPTGSYVVIDERFYSITMMTLSDDLTVVLEPGVLNGPVILQTLTQSGATSIFLISDTSFHVQGTVQVYSSGAISVFLYH